MFSVQSFQYSDIYQSETIIADRFMIAQPQQIKSHKTRLATIPEEANKPKQSIKDDPQNLISRYGYYYFVFTNLNVMFSSKRSTVNDKSHRTYYSKTYSTKTVDSSN